MQGAVGPVRAGACPARKAGCGAAAAARREPGRASRRSLGVLPRPCRLGHAFLTAGEASLSTRPLDADALESGRLKAKLGEMLIERELLEAKIAALEARGPGPLPAAVRGHEPVRLACQRQVYGLARVSRIWRVSRATVHRHLSPALGPCRRAVPARSGRCRMRRCLHRSAPPLTGSPFHGEGHRKVWARLRLKGVPHLQTPRAGDPPSASRTPLIRSC